jgi:hypothetical protein
MGGVPRLADNDKTIASGGSSEMGIQSSFRYAPSKSALAAVLIVLNGFAAGAALAASQEGDTKASFFGSKYIVTLGGYFPFSSSDLTLTGSRGGGDKISSKDLGLDDSSSSLWGSFNWRFLPRHQLHLEYFQIGRSGERSAGRDFTIGDTDVGIGASLTSKTDLGLGRITYGYSIIKKSKWDLAFNVGVHIATVKASVTASGNISENGVPIASGSRTEATSTLTFPLPHIGGSLAYRFGPKVTGVLTGLIFTIDLGQQAGTLIEADAMVMYQITKHFGLGGGAKYYHISLKNDPAGAEKVEYNMDFIGPAFFVYGNF